MKKHVMFPILFSTRPIVRCFQETPLCGTTVKLHEPVGVVGIICPQVAPLLGFVSLFAPAVARGNCVVIVPSMSCPLPALDLYQVNLCINTLTLKGCKLFYLLSYSGVYSTLCVLIMVP